jgi:hypothetical protein
VAKNGHPRSANDALKHRFIGTDRNGSYLTFLQDYGLHLTKSHFGVLAENTAVSWQIVRQGLGIGVTMEEIAALTPSVVRVLDDIAPISFPLWLVTHRELHTAQRIRSVPDCASGQQRSQRLAAPRCGCRYSHGLPNPKVFSGATHWPDCRECLCTQ